MAALEGVAAAIAQHGPTAFALVIDSRAVRLSHDGEQTALVQRSIDGLLGRLRDRIARYVMVAPRDWSTPWWHGVHDFARLPCAWRIATDAAAAWDWLALTSPQRDAVAGLVAGSSAHGPITSEVEALVGLMLDADVEVAARHLGMSVRSLQRALGQEGQTFHAVRTRLRVVAACDLLRSGEKVEAVAREVGFASTSHFVTWFRQHAGALPRDFRRSGAAALPDVGSS